MTAAWLGGTVYHYPTGEEAFSRKCEAVADRLGFTPVSRPSEATVAVAPLLTEKLAREQYDAPEFGTLIFHPSALPYRRGPDSIRNTIAAGERVSAATWFWAADGYDTGPICEQQVVLLLPGERPRTAYVDRFQPAALIALARALEGVKIGRPARTPQDEALATYDRPLV